MEGVYLLMILFCLTFKTVFNAEIPVFVKMGDSVQLDLQTQELPAKSEDLYWMKEKSVNIVKYTIESKTAKIYFSKDRVDFNNQSFSLTLKKMQKTDSGLYTARTAGSEFKDIVIYRISVIDAVEAPVLTVNSNRSIGNSCTVNFTCRAHELTINSSYQSNRCSPQEVTSHEINTLILSSKCSEGFIICNYSNPVSWREDKTEIKLFCVDNKGSHISGPDKSYLYGVLAFGLVLLALIILIARRYFKKKKGAREGGSAVYDQVQVHEMPKINSDSHTYDVPERIQAKTQNKTTDNQPSTTYCTVGQFQKPTIPPETDHTIYSTVCKQPPKKQKEMSSDEAKK